MIQKKVVLKYVVDCDQPVNDGIMDVASFEKFLREKIKVNGKAGVLGDKVTIAREKTKITVSAQAPFSKRYLKYLSKKFLKKNQLRDWLHVVASDKQTYVVKYYRIDDGEEGEGN